MTPRLRLLAVLVACGDKPPADPVAPTNGSTKPISTPGSPPDAASLPETPSRIPLRAGGKSPNKTTAPLAREQLSKLSALEIPGLTRTVRKLDDAFLDVEHALAEPPIHVGVTIQPCLRCLPMKIERWRAEADALRVSIPPDLRERSDTKFEITAIAIGGAPAIATYQLGHAPGDAPIFDEAVAVYWNDGVNQIRAIARYAGPPPAKSGVLADGVEHAELEQLAVAVLDRYAQAW